MRIWKEVVSPDTYFYIDPKSMLPRSMTVTADDVRRQFESNNAMLSDGIKVPIPLEHQPTAIPLTPEELQAHQLRNNTGFVEKYEMRGDALWSLCNIEDEEAAKRLPTTIKFTSPWFTSFTAGNGKRYDGVIGHLALTSRPRITNQKPFDPADVALSINGASLPFAPLSGLSLSKAGLLRNNKPVFQGAFSILAGAKLAGYDETPKDAPPKKDKPAGDKPKEGKSDAKPDVTPELGAGLLGEEVAEEEMDLCDVLCDLMAIFGVDLPPGTTEENLLQNIVKAGMEKLKAEKGMGDLGSDTLGSDTLGSDTLGSDTMGSDTTKAGLPPTSPNTVAEPPPLYMSLADVQAVTDPKERRYAEAMFSLHSERAKDREQLMALQQAKIDEYRSFRDRRVARLAAAMTAKNRDVFLAQVADAKLSLGNDGKVIDPLNAILGIMEETLKDMPALLKNPMAGAEPHPVDYKPGQISPERRKQLADEMAERAGVKASA